MTPGAATAQLDGLELARVDPAGMLVTVEASGDRWADGLSLAAAADDPRQGRLRAVVVCGMGGSGIAADVARVVASQDGTGVPVVGVKGYRLPSWIGPRTLVIGVSHSGDTEETLGCLAAALEARCQIAVVTSGGRVAALADDHGWPHVAVPGQGQPRANLPNLVGAVLGLLEAADVVRDVVQGLAGVPDHVRAAAQAFRHDVPTSDNPVKRAALTLDGQVPVFYGATGFPALVALRAKCQVNENAKRPAFHHELPELNHNEVVGWDRLPDVSSRFGLVAVRDPDEHPQVAKRFEVTSELVGPAFGASVRIDLEGDHPFARFAGGVLFVDLLSVYLGLIEGVDPTPVDRIAQLKRRIAT